MSVLFDVEIKWIVLIYDRQKYNIIENNYFVFQSTYFVKQSTHLPYFLFITTRTNLRKKLISKFEMIKQVELKVQDKKSEKYV